jgi:hypothetical protein
MRTRTRAGRGVGGPRRWRESGLTVPVLCSSPVMMVPRLLVHPADSPSGSARQLRMQSLAFVDSRLGAARDGTGHPCRGIG